MASSLGGSGEIGCSLGRKSEKGGQVARRQAAPRGANFSLRESMCQIAWESLRAMSTWAGELLWRCEALDLADLGGDHERKDPADPGHRQEQRDIWVLGVALLEATVDLGDLLFEVVDQLDRGGDVAPPRLGRATEEALLHGSPNQVRGWRVAGRP